MIVHYKQGTKNFLGMDNIITPLIVHAELERELNGVFNAELLVIKDSEKKYEEIKVLDFIKIPTPSGDQLFRIIDVDDTATYTVTLFCKHVFFDLQKRLIKDTFIQQRNGTQALQQILNNLDAKTEFTAFSDITNLNNLRLVRTRGVDAILGGNSDNYLIERYKGELDVDNFKIKLLKKLGADRGYEIREGKNLTGYNYKEDSSELCTRLMPVLFDGKLIPETYIDSENINKYDMIHTNTIKFDDIKLKERLEDGTIKPDTEDYVNEGYDTESSMFDEARKRCKQLFTEGLDKIRVQATVKFVDLVKTEQYKDFQFLHRLDLGDTVHFILEKYNLRVAERIVSYRYNSITKEYIELELGHAQDNIFSSGGGINGGGSNGSGGVGSGGGSDSGDSNLGIEFDKWYDKIITDVTNQISSGIKDSYVLVRANEILIMDTKDVATAQKVWRWNNAGLGFSSNGYNGTYTTAMTSTGQFVINEITCRQFVGDLIQAGTIQANRLSVEAKGEIREGLVTETNFNVELEKINMSVSETNKVVTENKTLTDLAIQEAIKEGKKYVDDNKAITDKEIGDLTTGVGDLGSYLEGAYKDGILDTQEKEVLKQKIIDLGVEKADVIAQVDALISEKELAGTTELTTLNNSKANFNMAHATLVNRINAVITPTLGEKSNFVVNPTAYSFKPTEKIIIQYSGLDLTYGYLYGIGSDTIYSESGDSTTMTFPPQAKGVYKNCYIGTYDSNNNWIDSNYFDITIEETVAPPPEDIKVTEVSLDRTSHTFTTLNATIKLNATISPSNATNKNVTWTSSNSSVAIVSADGTVTAKKNGNCIITVTTVDGNKTAICNISVNEIDTSIPVSSVSINPANKSCYEGDTFSVQATVYPTNATDKTINWTSSNTIIATIDESGKVTARAKGNCTITAKSNNDKTATCNVAVLSRSDNQLTQAFQDYAIKLVDLREAMNTATLKIAEVKATTKFEELKVYTDRELTIVTTNIKENSSAIEVLKNEISLTVTGEELENTVITIKTDIEKAKNEAVKYADDLKAATDSEINDVATSVSDLNTTMTGAFKDGVISEAEAKAIKENLKRCEKEKLEADKQFNVLYNDLALEGEARNNLYYAKVDYDTTYSDLTECIKEVIADNKATTEEIKNVDSKNSIYNSTNAILVQSVSEATKSIEDKKKEEAINSANDYTTTEITKTNETIAGIDIKLGEITSKVSEVQGQVTEVDGIVTSNTERINSAEEKITPEAVITTVTSSKTYTDDLTGKVSTDEVVSSINQTAEAIKIKANKIQLEGTVTAGTGGRQVKINNGDYSAIIDGGERMFFGSRDFENNYRVPKFYMGAFGFDFNNHNYFGMTSYRGNGDNPEGNTYAYQDLSYRCINSNFKDWSNIKMYSSGRIRVAAVENLEITTNHVDGSYGGAEERRLALFSSDKSKIFNSNLQIGCIRNKDNGNGLILGDDSHSDSNKWARVRVNTDSAGAKFFRPATQTGDIGCGSTSFPWKNVVTKTYYATDNIVSNPCSKVLNKNGSDILDSIEFIQPLTLEEPAKIDVSAISGTVYAPVEENTQAIDTTELLKLALMEIKQLKERVKILETR